jgi:hypothetical protein
VLNTEVSSSELNQPVKLVKDCDKADGEKEHLVRDKKK